VVAWAGVVAGADTVASEVAAVAGVPADVAFAATGVEASDDCACANVGASRTSAGAIASDAVDRSALRAVMPGA
jgi:hypothetical protein